MSNSVSPWIKAFLEGIFKYNVPRHYLEGPQQVEGSSSSSRREKIPKPVRRLEKAVQIIKYIPDLKALVVSDTEHTIPVYLTNSCVLDFEANGVRTQDLRTSIIVLQDYHFTTSIQATGNIEMELLRKYYKELSFPCSMICNQFLLAASDLQIMKNPTDINLDKSLFANMIPFELYLKLSLRQFGAPLGYIPPLGDDFHAIKRFDQPLTEQDVDNLPFIISRNSLKKKVQEETLGEENEENMIPSQTQCEENTWDNFHSQYLTMHTQTASQFEDDDELRRAAMDCDDDGIHSTGSLHFEVMESDEDLVSESLAEHLNTQDINGATQFSQTDERDQLKLFTGEMVFTQTSESNEPPGLDEITDEKTDGNRDNELQSQYTYESVNDHIGERGKEVEFTQQETFSFVESTPAEVVIINDNTTNNEIKLRKRKGHQREYKKPTAIFNAKSVSEHDSSDEEGREKEEEQGNVVRKDNKENDPQSEALVIREIQAAITSSKEEEGSSLIGKSVAKLLPTDLRRPQHKTLIRGQVTGFSSPFYLITFDNGVQQQLLHHELQSVIVNDEFPTVIQRLPEDLETPNQHDTAKDVHHPSNVRTSADGLLSSSLTPISKDKEEGDRSALNISKVTMDLSDDMDNVLTQPQVATEHARLPDPTRQEFFHLQSPKKKAKKAIIPKEVARVDLTAEKSLTDVPIMPSSSSASKLPQADPAFTTNKEVARLELRKKSIESLLKRSEPTTMTTKTVIEMLKDRKSRIAKRLEKEMSVHASPSSVKSSMVAIHDIAQLSSPKAEKMVPAVHQPSVRESSDSEIVDVQPVQSEVSEKLHKTPVKDDEFRSILLQASSLRKSGSKQESPKPTNMQKLISTFLMRFKRKSDVIEQERDGSFQEEDLRWLHSYADYRKQKRQRLE